MDNLSNALYNDSVRYATAIHLPVEMMALLEFKSFSNVVNNNELLLQLFTFNQRLFYLKNIFVLIDMIIQTLHMVTLINCFIMFGYNAAFFYLILILNITRALLFIWRY